jgi:hypothetical protein
MEIIENNPDKDLFMDYFEKKYSKKEDKNNSGVEHTRILESYMNFSGQLQAAQQTQENKSLTTQTSLMVFAGAIIIAIAIISKK